MRGKRERGTKQNGRGVPLQIERWEKFTDLKLHRLKLVCVCVQNDPPPPCLHTNYLSPPSAASGAQIAGPSMTEADPQVGAACFSIILKTHLLPVSLVSPCEPQKNLPYPIVSRLSVCFQSR